MNDRESKAATTEAIHAIDYGRGLELFETACKVFVVPMKVKLPRDHCSTIATN